MLILDTCALIWLTSAPQNLSDEAKAAIDASAELFVSDASVWEICLKWQAGKLKLPHPPRYWLNEQMGKWLLSRVPIEPADLFRSSELPDHHRDPFDRLLVAQTLERGAQLITPDGAIHAYPVAVLW